MLTADNPIVVTRYSATRAWNGRQPGLLWACSRGIGVAPHSRAVVRSIRNETDALAGGTHNARPNHNTAHRSVAAGKISCAAYAGAAQTVEAHDWQHAAAGHSIQVPGCRACYLCQG